MNFLELLHPGGEVGNQAEAPVGGVVHWKK